MAGRLPDFGKLTSMATNIGSMIGLGGAAIVGTAWLGKNSIYTVEAGHRAIKFHRYYGVQKDTYSEGVRFMIPWVERPITFDIRARPHTTTSLTGSRDLQMVHISLRALCRPDERSLPQIYTTLGLDYEEKVLNSIVHEVLKSVVAQYNASELIVQRDMVSRTIRQRLIQRAHDFHILLDDVALTHINFSPEYEKAVESKQVAQQQAQKAIFLVLKAQEEKKRTIIHAEGEKQSAQMIGDAIRNNPGYIELRRMDIAKEVASTLAKSSNRMILNTESLMLNLLGGKTGPQLATEGVNAKKK